LQLHADDAFTEVYTKEQQKIPDYLLSKQQNNKNNGQKTTY